MYLNCLLEYQVCKRNYTIVYIWTQRSNEANVKFYKNVMIQKWFARPLVHCKMYSLLRCWASILLQPYNSSNPSTGKPNILRELTAVRMAVALAMKQYFIHLQNYTYSGNMATVQSFKQFLSLDS